jgi:predicted TIM-barrel fold metal-dependent hydrolase
MTEERLISADSHVRITADWVRERLPKSSLEAYNEAVTTLEALELEQRGGVRKSLEDFGDLAPGASDPGYWEPHARLAAMDRDGVYAEVLYSELSAFRQFHLAGDHWKPVARAFNDALSDFAAVDPDRLVVSYQLPIIDIPHAVEEIERLAALGARSVQLPNYPAELGFPDYHEPAYDPLWAAMSETEITISQHLGFKDTQFDIYRRDPTPYKSIFAPFTGLMIVENVSFWLMTGVLERFPKLRIVFVEPSLTQMLNWVRMLDGSWQRGRERIFPGVTKSPMEMFHQQMFMTIIGGDRHSLDQRHDVGVENIMWSTDFPHPASTWPNSREVVNQLFEGVPADERKLIVCDNAARVYGLAAA